MGFQQAETTGTVPIIWAKRGCPFSPHRRIYVCGGPWPHSYKTRHRSKLFMLFGLKAVYWLGDVASFLWRLLSEFEDLDTIPSPA